MKQAILTVDLGFGDAGKGSIVDFLTREHNAHTVIRYNGGAQAGHRVVTEDGREHVFAQFGSGTLAGADTHLSRYMLLDPIAMLAEAAHLRTLGESDVFGRTTIDRRALIITPFQRAVNRLKEIARGDNRHGSCGMGIGETMSDALEHGEQVLFAGDLAMPDQLYAKLCFLRDQNTAKLRQIAFPDIDSVAQEMSWLADDDQIDWLMETYAAFATQAQIVPEQYLQTILDRPGTVIFEGAQGVLLDEWHGFHPHTTWSTTTLANADRLLAEADYAGDVTRIGLTRAYATRHGAGPFVTEDALLTHMLPDARNGSHEWQQGFRVGWLDLVLLRYALVVTGGIDCLAVTCLDRLANLPELFVCDQYRSDPFMINDIALSPIRHDLGYQEQITHSLAHCQPRLTPVENMDALLAMLATELDRPIGLLSFGASSGSKQVVQAMR